jgi:hypothetical protein
VTTAGGSGPEESARATGGDTAPAPGRPPQVRGRWLALCALVFPLIFFAVVATGLYSMLYGRMSMFRPGAAHPADASARPVEPRRGR